MSHVAASVRILKRRQAEYRKRLKLSQSREEILDLFTEESKERTSRIKARKNALKHQRKRSLKGAKAIQEGGMIDSSWISELRYFPNEEKVWTLFQGRKYTFRNVPEGLFNAWYAGAAATTTSDTSKERRWNIYDFPSLGAFFNQRIKKKYKGSKGWL